MQLWQYCLLVTARSLYILGVLKTVVAATGACHGSGLCISSKEVQGRLQPFGSPEHAGINN
jgi:hypothetical protein